MAVDLSHLYPKDRDMAYHDNMGVASCSTRRSNRKDDVSVKINVRQAVYPRSRSTEKGSSVPLNLGHDARRSPAARADGPRRAATRLTSEQIDFISDTERANTSGRVRFIVIRSFIFTVSCKLSLPYINTERMYRKSRKAGPGRAPPSRPAPAPCHRKHAAGEVFT
ncbi:hypothetical protein EVAR_67889_1 [Eumeta japonica]|uniref:Uncharacterized protein n=1 Tax=Eumeta variegata TaxID=151549 RepID=A0A4C1YWL9_EUMVA|nr:hypothetical protein EVAR_67889_1 [Eumeta japonica]